MRAPRGKAYIVRIEPDGFVRKFWQAKDAPIHDMVYDAAADRLLISAGGAGKLLQLAGDGHHSILTMVREKQVFRLIPVAETGETIGAPRLFELHIIEPHGAVA